MNPHDTALSLQSLHARLQQVEAVQAIQALKAHYGSLADQKYTAGRERQPEARMREIARLQAACFTEDAVWEGGAGFGDSISGRPALEAWFNRSPWSFAVHFYGSAEISVQGDRAQGRWRLWQMAVRADSREAVLLAALTDEDYARQADGRWLHARVRFAQMHILPLPCGADPLASSLASLPPTPLGAALQP